MNNRLYSDEKSQWAVWRCGGGVRKSEREMTWKCVEVVKSKGQAMGKVTGTGRWQRTGRQPLTGVRLRFGGVLNLAT